MMRSRPHLLIFSLFTALASVPGIAFAAGPDPTKVYVESISYGGTGCPQGTVGQSISDDRSTFTLIFDSFVASSGPSVPVTENRKNCQVTVNLHIPQGWTYAVGGFTYRGYAQLPAGTNAEQSSTYYFEGSPLQLNQRTQLTGATSKDYNVNDVVPLPSLVFNSCNASEPLNINSQVRITGATTAQAQITIDSIDGKMQNVLAFQWQKC